MTFRRQGITTNPDEAVLSDDGKQKNSNSDKAIDFTNRIATSLNAKDYPRTWLQLVAKLLLFRPVSDAVGLLIFARFFKVVVVVV